VKFLIVVRVAYPLFLLVLLLILSGSTSFDTPVVRLHIQAILHSSVDSMATVEVNISTTSR